MTEDILLPFDLPAVKRKKVTADFEGGLISSDGGLGLCCKVRLVGDLSRDLERGVEA